MILDAGSGHVRWYWLILKYNLPAHYTDASNKNDVYCKRDWKPNNPTNKRWRIFSKHLNICNKINRTLSRANLYEF